MEIVHPCCCGLDVHAKTVVACLIKQGKTQTRTFSTMTDDLLTLSDWLRAEGCTHVAIESTGVYWEPVFNILEAALKVILVNARDVKAVPGRKTDVRACEWLADLLRHGLLRASFIPPAHIREPAAQPRAARLVTRPQPDHDLSLAALRLAVALARSRIPRPTCRRLGEGGSSAGRRRWPQIWVSPPSVVRQSVRASNKSGR
jgi:hypothetical protein